MNTLTRAAPVMALLVALLLTGCAAPARLITDLELDEASIIPSNDGSSVVAKGSLGSVSCATTEAYVVLNIRGCADGHGELDYSIFYLSGRERQGVISWHEGDQWSRLCGEAI